jgi:hypothetical protein
MNLIETSAATCSPDSDEYVSNQEEVEAMFADCTEIWGVVKLSKDYTGPLYLPNVTYISGGFGSVNSDDDHPFPAPLLTSINLPDLNNTYTIKITGASKLTTISFPKLVLVNDSITLTGLPDCAVDFSALTETSSLLVSGNSTRYVMFHTRQPQFTVSKPMFLVCTSLVSSLRKA